MQKKSNNKLVFTAIILIVFIAGVSGEPICGNGIIEEGEVCDGTNVDGKTCADFGYAEGDVSCCNDCENFNLYGCYNINIGTCSDGDGGMDYYISSNASQFIGFDHGESCPGIEAAGDIGPCEGGDFVIEDTCEGNVLSEAVCDEATGMPQAVEYDCSSEGKDCMNGACVILELQTNKSLIRRITDWLSNIF